MAKAKRSFVCKFGNVSIGDATASIKATFSRGILELSQAEEFFCARMLSVKLTLLENGESPAQKTLPNVERKEFIGTGSFAGYSVKAKTIGAGMTFSLSEIDCPTLSHFAKQEGLLTILKVMQAIESDEGDDVEEE